MRFILSERNIVVVLFVMVVITFSLAHEDSKKMEQIYQESQTTTTTAIDPTVKEKQVPAHRSVTDVTPVSYSE